MGIVIITLVSLSVMYGLTFLSYLSESKVLDELVSEN
ncbi:Hypothetical protein CRIB_1622 [Romboutsia ilealis]|jgi:hypothetical protein|uniref:Uncharacterized protein n=1 Tax=Romboutsia ilealis TaxID=1115758 RepID=A0A1V1I292_9FIRM|nr:Hypothetical protein CRIB_1622 [Romboutsia ilealis]